MRNITLLIFMTLFACSCQINIENSQNIDREELEKELLSAIEARHISWQKNDYDAHMKTYHKDWKRWAMREDKLLTKDEFISLWDRMKEAENSKEIEIQMIDFDILGDGNAALVHYTSTETFEWIGPENDRGWKTGDIYKGMLRWSDVLVKENDHWLCIGGHRDFSQPAAELIKLNEQ